jgi:hypothetical protein
MANNVFYYETDHKGEVPNNLVPDPSDSIPDQIASVLRIDASNDTKLKKLVGIYEKLLSQNSLQEQSFKDTKERYEKLLSENLKLKQMNIIEHTPRFKNKSDRISARSVDSPRTRAKNNVSIKKTQDNSQNYISIHFNDVKNDISSVAQSKQKISIKNPRPDQNFKSLKVKPDADKELKRYVKLVDSIYRIREQVGELGTRESKASTHGQDLQDLWKWLKEYFEESTNSKVKLLKLQKRNLNLVLFKDNAKKAMKLDIEDDEFLERLKTMNINFKMFETLVEKSKKALKFLPTKKSSNNNLLEFDKFLSKLINS